MDILTASTSIEVSLHLHKEMQQCNCRNVDCTVNIKVETLLQRDSRGCCGAFRFPTVFAAQIPLLFSTKRRGRKSKEAFALYNVDYAQTEFKIVYNSLKDLEIISSASYPDAAYWFSEALQMLRKERCLRGEEPTMDELLNPEIEQEDLDSELLRFLDGDTGTKEILEYLQHRNDEDDEEEEPEKSGLNCSKKDVIAAAEFLQKVAHHRPDLEAVLPLTGCLHKFRSAPAQEVEEAKVQSNITSFFK
ncbi:hypothetical protein DFH06DRAFT_1130412 [Mycena polygramma]|nr:hypothetical protein DFH06DRAFT_1130412 [Mycena polygramma]